MSRLLDVVLRENMPPAQRAALTACTVIAADNVAAYLEQSGDGTVQSLYKLPNIAPPLKAMFIEFEVGKPAGKIGWYFQAFDRETHDVWPVRSVSESQIDGARWLLQGFMYMERYPKQPQMWCELAVNHDGTLLPLAAGVPAYMRPTVGSVYGEQWEQNPYGEWMLPAWFALTIALWAITFMHTKNVVREELTPPEKLSKAHQKRHGAPLTRYYVLKVKSMRKVNDSEGKGGQHSSPALHICKGHFKHYGEDAPLFGRAVGVYWWDQQMRGRQSRGAVRKDYEVQP